MEFVYIILALQVVKLQYVHSHQCEPCEENTKCEIVYISEYTNDLPSKYFWKRDGQDVATCYTGEDSECMVYPDLSPHFKVTIHFESGTVRSSVVLFNVTRASGSLSSESEWRFCTYDDVTLKPVYTCQIKIFKKIDNATCTYETSKKGLRITCTSSYVYPESSCLFNISLDQIPYQLQLTPVLNHTVESTDLLYYSTVCTHVIPTDKLSLGFWEFNTTIFPDIHKDGKHCTSCDWGQTFRFNLTIEYPVVSLINCPITVDEGDEIVCVCLREDKSEAKTIVYWGKQSDNTCRSSVLRVTARKNNTGFTCTVVNEFGWQTTVKYNIAINSQPIIPRKDCTMEKPNICSMQCYSHGEFCLNGKVYSCEDAEPDKIQEWCQSQNKSAIEAMISPSCKRACQSFKNVQTSEDTHTWAIVAIISIVVSCGLILFVLFYIKGRAIKLFLIKLLKRNKTPDNIMSQEPLHRGEAPNDDGFENVSDAGIPCTLIVLDQCPIEISIFEDLSADEFKNMRLNSKQNIDDYNVVVRYPNGSEDVMEDEEEFGAKRLEKCESVRIVEKRSKRISESEIDVRRRKKD